MAGGLRGERERHQRHNHGRHRIHQLAPPSDFVGAGLLLVVFQMGDVGGERRHRHLLGIDQEHIQKIALQADGPLFFRLMLGAHLIVFQNAAAHVFEQPMVIAAHGGRVGGGGFGQPELRIVAPHFHIKQSMVGQHFAHIDDVVALFEPQALAAGADFAADGAGFEIFGTLAHGRCEPFAQKGGGHGEDQAELQQNGNQFFGAHAAGFHHRELAARSELAQGNQAAD